MLLIIIVGCISAYLLWRFLAQAAPGPAYIPLYTHYYHLYQYFNETPSDIKFTQLLQEYGDVVQVSNVWLINNPKLLLQGEIVSNDSFKDIVNGIFVSSGKQRERIHNVLCRLLSNLDQVATKTREKSTLLVGEILQVSPFRLEINLEKTFKLLFQDITASLLGIETECIQSFSRDDWTLTQLVIHKAALIIQKRSEIPSFLWFFLGYSRFDSNVSTNAIYLKNAILTKMKDCRPENNRSSIIADLFENYLEPAPLRKDLLENSVTQDEMIGIALNILFMGHKATFKVLENLVHVLIGNSDVYVELQQEIDACDGQFSNIQNLQFLDWTIKETLRLFPPIQYICRKTVKPTDILGYKVPTNSTCYQSVLGLHQNCKDPQKFDPWRWNLEKIDLYSFGHGNYKCPGEKFAITQIKVALYVFMKHFKFEQADSDEHAVFVTRINGDEEYTLYNLNLWVLSM